MCRIVGHCNNCNKDSLIREAFAFPLCRRIYVNMHCIVNLMFPNFICPICLENVYVPTVFNNGSFVGRFLTAVKTGDNTGLKLFYNR